jgi:hypothetical protein
MHFNCISPLDTLSAQLVALGHTFEQRDDFLGPPVINLLREGYNDIQRLRRERQDGKRIICLVTEKPTRICEKSFLWNDEVLDDQWLARADIFPLVLKLVDACWCMNTGTARFIHDKIQCPAWDLDDLEAAVRGAVGCATWPIDLIALDAAGVPYTNEPHLIEEINFNNLVSYEGVIYLTPQRLGEIDFRNADHRSREGIVKFNSLDEARKVAAG